MSSKEFVEKLKELKYPGACELKPASFDWLFSDEEVGPFLKMFIEKTSSANLVTSQELSRYNELCENGGVIEGELLDLLQGTREDSENGSENADLASQLQNIEKKCANVANLKTTLEHQLEKSEEKLLKVKDAYNKSWIRNQKMLQDCATASEKLHLTLKSILDELTRTKSALFKAINLPNSENILASKCLTRYLGIEQKVNNCIKTILTNFTTASSVAKMSEGSDDMVEIFESIERDELRLLDSTVKAAAAEAACAELNILNERMKKPGKPQADILADVNAAVAAVRIKNEKLYETAREMTIEKVALFQLEWTVKKLDLILGRKSNLSQIINEVMDNVVQQYSRCDIVQACVSTKKKQFQNILDSHNNLVAICNSEVQCQQSRTACEAAMGEKGADTKSQFLLSSSNLTVLAGNSDQLESKKEDVDKAMTAIYEHIGEVRTQLDQLHHDTSMFENMLWDQDSDRELPPGGAPGPVTAARDRLAESLLVIEDKIASHSKTYRERQAILKNNLRLVQERSLFVLFHTDPALLKKTVEELEARKSRND